MTDTNNCSIIEKEAISNLPYLVIISKFRLVNACKNSESIDNV